MVEIHSNGRQGPGARFTNDFLPAIQIRWKFRLAVIPLLAIRSQQIFAHTTTAQLSCHVQNFVAITVLESRWERNVISIEFELRWKKRQWNGALFMPNVYIQLQWLLMSQQHEEPGDEWLNFTAFLGTADREVHIVHKSHKHEEPGHQQPWYHSGPVFYLCLRTVLDSKNLVLLLAKIISFSVPVLATRS